ncbi:hypothetical protein AB1Y20_012157 [Prymnesium parvum]|uniref:Uncharacterized protein n=1 Tax=Prymnesium parvum TaxID=97485 RepID=A0AB34IQE7_PRYPA
MLLLAAFLPLSPRAPSAPLLRSPSALMHPPAADNANFPPPQKALTPHLAPPPRRPYFATLQLSLHDALGELRHPTLASLRLERDALLRASERGLLYAAALAALALVKGRAGWRRGAALFLAVRAAAALATRRPDPRQLLPPAALRAAAAAAPRRAAEAAVLGALSGACGACALYASGSLLAAEARHWATRRREGRRAVAEAPRLAEAEETRRKEGMPRGEAEASRGEAEASRGGGEASRAAVETSRGAGEAPRGALARRAAWQCGAHALLALCASVWAAEAAFVLCLGAAQRLRLLLLALAAVAVEQGRRFRRYVPDAQQRAQDWLPKSAEEMSQRVNYQLNLWGLQMESAMTTAWSGYLRRRQAWLTSSKRSSAPSKSAGLQSWWDLRVARMNSAWVTWQMRAATDAKKPAAKKLPPAKGGNAAASARSGGAAEGAAKPAAALPASGTPSVRRRIVRKPAFLDHLRGARFGGGADEEAAAHRVESRAVEHESARQDWRARLSGNFAWFFNATATSAATTANETAVRPSSGSETSNLSVAAEPAAHNRTRFGFPFM